MLHSIYFSPSGTTRKVARLIAEGFGDSITDHDITVDTPSAPVGISDEDSVSITMPVYVGRIPPLAVERLRNFRGNGAKAIVSVVYGNRHYDDALAELCDIARSLGFDIVAAGAFIGRHCIFPAVASNRPDGKDEELISRFARQARQAYDEGRPLSPESVPGNRPYREAHAVPLRPEASAQKCDSCGTCITQCPTRAIDPADPLTTDKSRCISCARCISVCPRGARRFRGMMYRLAAIRFTGENSRRLEPEWFIG